MDRIVPHLWYDTEAVEAARLYTSILPGSRISSVATIPGTPSGDAELVTFELAEQSFMAISAGPGLSFTPAISFLLRCGSREEVDRTWGALSEGGATLMPLDSYPFSERYGWLTDRYGLSWQVMYDPEGKGRQRIVPTLMFTSAVCGRSEEAIAHYTSVFPGSRVDHLMRYERDEEPNRPGTVKHAGFRLFGQELAAMDSAGPHDFGFTEAISLLVRCDTQEEIDRYWEALSAVPGAEQCGWLKDRFGVSWQISPAILDDMMTKGTGQQVARVVQAFLPMKKLDIAELRRAYEGHGQPTQST